MDALKGTYQLEELDRTRLARTYIGNQIKKFIKRGYYFYSAYDKEQGVKRESVNKSERSDLVNKKRDLANKFSQRV